MTASGPFVSAIRRFALDDGPGIRTTVFFKGCPLACIWCHNPECMRPSNEIAFHPDLCIECGHCAAACKAGAIRLDSPERVVREACTVCGDCVEACPATALTLVGTAYPVDTLLRLLLRDRLFFEASRGGVTLSGGEPTLHMDYLAGLLCRLKESGIHTAVQTCGLFDLAAFVGRLLPHIDLLFFDIKLLDSAEHRKYTGAPNTVILENFRRLTLLARERLVPRVPLIPGITATARNLRGIAAWLDALGYQDCDVLAYNPGCIARRQALGMAISPELPAMAHATGRQRLSECLSDQSQR